MLKSISKACVIVPHPDDETLGMGGVIALLTKLGIEVQILVVGGHLPPLYNYSDFVQTKAEMLTALDCLGVTIQPTFLELPATMFNQLPVHEFNAKVQGFIREHRPDVVFTCFYDRHIDHRVVFDSVMVAVRPIGAFFPKYVLAYETLSETHWNAPLVEPQFVPTWNVDISSVIELKLKAVRAFQSQTAGVGSRDARSVEALAAFRGSQAGVEYAEAFHVLRISS